MNSLHFKWDGKCHVSHETIKRDSNQAFLVMVNEYIKKILNMYKNIKLNKNIYTNIWSRTRQAKPVHTYHLFKEGKTRIEQSGTGQVR